MTRPRVTFWLDNRKPDEQWLLEKIPLLKQRRQFAKLIREGLALMIHFHDWSIKAQDIYDLVGELRAGETKKLFSMFPHLREKLTSGQGAEPGGGGGGDLGKEIVALRELIIAQQNAGGYVMQSTKVHTYELPSAPASASGPKPLLVSKPPAPLFEEDDDIPTLVLKKADTNSSLNFVSMMQSLDRGK